MFLRRNEIKTRQCVYISRDVHSKILKIVNDIAGREISVGGYVDTATAIDRVVRMVKEQKVTAYTGEDIPVVAHSVCVHGDGARALGFVQALRSAFAENGIAVAPLAEVIADV